MPLTRTDRERLTRRKGGDVTTIGNTWRATLAIAATLALMGVASAQDLSPYRKGGIITTFRAVVDHYNFTGERFRISGECKSACTMFLGIRNVCVEPSARLYFHAGHAIGDRQHMLAAPTTAMMLQYNDALRSFVSSNGYMAKPEFSVITGSDLIKKFGYRSCK
jgi:hypothetical protein